MGEEKRGPNWKIIGFVVLAVLMVTLLLWVVVGRPAVIHAEAAWWCTSRTITINADVILTGDWTTYEAECEAWADDNFAVSKACYGNKLWIGYYTPAYTEFSLCMAENASPLPSR